MANHLNYRLRIFTALIRFVLLVLWAVSGASSAISQTVPLIPNLRTPARHHTIDESTEWVLYLKSEVVIDSPLVRLRDIASPTVADAPWWPRLGGSIIALTPLERQEMVIELSRLQEVVERTAAASQVHWTGASRVVVRFERAAGTLPQRATHPSESTQGLTEPNVQQTSYSVPDAQIAIGPSQSPSLISQAEQDRIEKLIQYAVDRFDVKLRDAFDIKIELSADAWDQLRELRVVDAVRWSSAPAEGTNAASIVGMNAREQVTAPVVIELKARPLVVAARIPLRRGHVIASDDLHLIPAPRNLPTDDVIRDIEQCVGLQVQNVLQKDRPLSSSSVAPVVLIERGDVVEVTVAAGGITVATAAKALAQGTHGELIPVETIDPRRKLVARVTAAGKVEILTRPPRVE